MNRHYSAFLPILAMAAMLPMRAIAATDAGADPYGTWFGTLVTDRGVCPTEMDSILQIDSASMTFTPGGGALVLRGKPDIKQGRFHAQIMLTDSKRQPLPMVFEGKPEGETITGEFGTPTCRAHIVMTRGKTHAMKNFLGH